MFTPPPLPWGPCVLLARLPLVVPTVPLVVALPPGFAPSANSSAGCIIFSGSLPRGTMRTVSACSLLMLLRIVGSCLISCVPPGVLIRMRQLGLWFRTVSLTPSSAGGFLCFLTRLCFSQRSVICIKVYNPTLGLSHNICYVSRFPLFYRLQPRQGAAGSPFTGAAALPCVGGGGGTCPATRPFADCLLSHEKISLF